MQNFFLFSLCFCLVVVWQQQQHNSNSNRIRQQSKTDDDAKYAFTSSSLHFLSQFPGWAAIQKRNQLCVAQYFCLSFRRLVKMNYAVDKIQGGWGGHQTEIPTWTNKRDFNGTRLSIWRREMAVKEINGYILNPYLSNWLIRTGWTFNRALKTKWAFDSCDSVDAW